MVVVVIVLVIILQNEPITTDTITILTRHFIILTRKKKYDDKCFRKVWPAFLAIVHHFYPADGMVFHRLCLDVLRLAHALVFGLTHPPDPTHALVRGLEPRTTPRHPRTGQCVNSL